MPDQTEQLLALLPPAGTPAGHVPKVQTGGSIAWQAESGGGGGGGGTPFGLRSVTPSFAHVPFTVARGDNQKAIYTCPAGKVAFLLGESGGPNTSGDLLLYGFGDIVAYTGNADGSNLIVTWSVDGKDHGDMDLSFVPFTNEGLQLPTILNAGQELQVTSDAAAGAIITAGILHVLELDAAESGIVSLNGILPTVETAIYTCPAGKTAQLIQSPLFLARMVATTPVTHGHGRQIPAGFTSADAFTHIDPGGFFEGSNAGGANGPGTINPNPFDLILGPGDSFHFWVDDTGLAVTYSFAVQEVAN